MQEGIWLGMHEWIGSRHLLEYHGRLCSWLGKLQEVRRLCEEVGSLESGRKRCF